MRTQRATCGTRLGAISTSEPAASGASSATAWIWVRRTGPVGITSTTRLAGSSRVNAAAAASSKKQIGNSDVAVAVEAPRFLPDGDEDVTDRVRYEVAVIAPPGEPDRQPPGVTFIQRAEGAHIALGDGQKQYLVARAAVHVLTVASPGRKSFTPGGKFPGPVHAGMASAQASSLHVFALYLGLPGAAGRKVRIEERAPPSLAGSDVLAALLKAVQ